MDIEFKGGNCVVINHKKDVFVIDPKLSDIGLKDQGSDATAQLLTENRFEAAHGEDTVLINNPGEYEVRNLTIRGVSAVSARDSGDGKQKTTIYQIDCEGVTVAVFGHIASKLSEEQLESIGVIDVMILPVGGHGYTLEPKDAAALVREISPKIVIPTHYNEEGVTYEVPQANLDEFIKEVGATHETTPKLKLKAGQLPENLTIYEITRSK